MSLQVHAMSDYPWKGHCFLDLGSEQSERFAVLHSPECGQDLNRGSEVSL